MAPDRNSTGESQGPPDTRPVLHVALIIPVAKYVNFTKWVKGNVRVARPKGWEGEIVLTVLPDLGDELIDFDQYEIPTLTITKLEGAPK